MSVGPASPALALAALLLLAPAALHAQDDAAGVGAVALPGHAREAIAVRGRVLSIRGAGSWWTIETDSAPSSFLLYAAREADIPIRVGDSIDAAIDCQHGGFHYVCSAVVRDGAGELLLAVAGDGEPTLAPGWALVGDGPRPRGTGRIEQPLVLEHLGARITTRVSRWRTVRAADGVWRIHGSYSHVVGTAVRVPDSVDYRSYAITRVR